MSSGIHYEENKKKSKEKKNDVHNIKPKKRCPCGKGLAFMQTMCLKCQKKSSLISTEVKP